jgi:F0F1-type ATP synthase assembly protein I
MSCGRIGGRFLRLSGHHHGPAHRPETMTGRNGADDEEPPRPAVSGSTRGIAKFASAGVELAAAVGGACLLGYWIDRHFETSPWGLVICATLGIVGGTYNLVRLALREMVRTAEEERRRRRGKRDDGAR